MVLDSRHFLFLLELSSGHKKSIIMTESKYNRLLLMSNHQKPRRCHLKSQRGANEMIGDQVHLRNHTHQTVLARAELCFQVPRRGRAVYRHPWRHRSFDHGMHSCELIDQKNNQINSQLQSHLNPRHSLHREESNHVERLHLRNDLRRERIVPD